MNLSSISSIFGIHQKIADDVCAGVQYSVKCLTCKTSREISSEEFAQYLAHGWPKCCGYTMRLEKR